MKITIAGLDIAKNKFHFYGVNQVGKKVKKRVLTRSEVQLRNEFERIIDS